MLYFLSELSDGGDAFNLFRYITFRSGGAFFTALILSFIFGAPLIRKLRKMQKMGNLSVRTGLLVILFKKRELQRWVEF